MRINVNLGFDRGQPDGQRQLLMWWSRKNHNTNAYGTSKC